MHHSAWIKAMYEAFYRLHKGPFSTTPDPACCYTTEQLSAIGMEITRCLAGDQGIAVLSSGPGLGKTLLGQRLSINLSEQFIPVFLGSGGFPTRRSLLQAILYELQQPYSGMSDQELRLELNTILKGLQGRYEAAVLIIDEADQLSDRLLDEIRALGELSNYGKSLMRIVLLGQPGLEEILTRPGLSAFNQRIGSQLTLPPFTRAESKGYIEFRIACAGGLVQEIFEPEALELIAEACNGIPRCLNQLCDHSLLLGFVNEKRRIGSDLVKEALMDVQQLPLQWNPNVAIREMDTAPLLQDQDEPFPEWNPSMSIEVGGTDWDSIVEDSPGTIIDRAIAEQTTPSEIRTSENRTSEKDRKHLSEEAVDDLYASIDAGRKKKKKIPSSPIQSARTPEKLIESIAPLLEERIGSEIQAPGNYFSQSDEDSIAKLVTEIVEEVRPAITPPADREDTFPLLRQEVDKFPTEGTTNMFALERTTNKFPSEGTVDKIARFDTVMPETEESAGPIPKPNYKQLFSLLRKRRQQGT